MVIFITLKCTLHHLDISRLWLNLIYIDYREILDIDMATDASFIEYVVDQAGLGDSLTYRKMFGEYALYFRGKVIAFACDNSLFIKPTNLPLAMIADLSKAPPYPGTKDYIVADVLLDEPEQLRQLLIETEKLLPVPKPKKAKK